MELIASVVGLNNMHLSYCPREEKSKNEIRLTLLGYETMTAAGYKNMRVRMEAPPQPCEWPTTYTYRFYSIGDSMPATVLNKDQPITLTVAAGNEKVFEVFYRCSKPHRFTKRILVQGRSSVLVLFFFGKYSQVHTYIIRKESNGDLMESFHTSARSNHRNGWRVQWQLYVCLLSAYLREKISHDDMTPRCVFEPIASE